MNTLVRFVGIKRRRKDTFFFDLGCVTCDLGCVIGDLRFVICEL